MSELTIDTKAIAANYKLIKDKVGRSCAVASVVKANAYGCGVAAASKALQEQGCTLFFVATLPEAIELRMIIGDELQIAMLNGYNDSEAKLYIENNIIPVLNHSDESSAYQALAKTSQKKLPAILHIDTGMNRLGFKWGFDTKTSHTSQDFEGIDLTYIMTHFASAEEHQNPKSAAQAEAFFKVTENFPDTPKSLCNSAGVFHDSSWHQDMVRPGMALYGLNPTPDAPNPMQPVVTLNAKILQIKDVEAGKTCGYNETYRFYKKSRVAIVSMGYADGFLRSLSNAGSLFWNGIVCPIRGRVSMDLTIVDLTTIPDDKMPIPGDMMEVIGPNQSADDLAAQAGTIGYEILTSLSRRYKRIYL